MSEAISGLPVDELYPHVAALMRATADSGALMNLAESRATLAANLCALVVASVLVAEAAYIEQA